MAGLACHVPVQSRGHGLLYLDMAILASRLSVDMPHAARPGLVAVDAFNLLCHVHVLRQVRRLGEIPAEIAVPSPPLHRACVADEGAPAAAGAVGRGGDAAHGMRPLLPRGCVVAVEASRVTDIARLLLRY